MNNRWRLIALWALPIALVVFFGLQVVRGGGPMQAANGPTEAPRNSAVARVAYGRFLDYLEAGRITAVEVSDVAAQPLLKQLTPISITAYSACGLTFLD